MLQYVHCGHLRKVKQAKRTMLHVSRMVLITMKILRCFIGSLYKKYDSNTRLIYFKFGILLSTVDVTCLRQRRLQLPICFC